MTSNVGVELIKLSPKTVALLISVFAVFNGLGRPIFGLLTDKLSYKKSMLISYILIIIAALLMLFANDGSIILFSISFSIFWFNLGGWLAIAPTSTLIMYGTKHYSQNYGVVFTAYGIGAIIGVLSSGLIIDVLKNYHSIFYFVIGLCIIGVVSIQVN
jgi:OFA family oxalate/formate antiporter-like MFS transporter